MRIDRHRTLPVALDLCLFITYAQCVFDDKEQILKKWKLACVDETKVDPELIIFLRAGNWQINNLPLQKWALCVLVSGGIMSHSGVFLLDSALAQVPEKDRPAVSKKVDKCLYKQSHLPHEIAWHYLKCYNQKKPKEFLLI